MLKQVKLYNKCPNNLGRAVAILIAKKQTKVIKPLKVVWEVKEKQTILLQSKRTERCLRELAE